MTGRSPMVARPGLLDACVAAVLTVLSQAELASSGTWSPLAAAFSMVMTGSLMMRRPLPWVPVVMVPLAFGGQALLLDPVPSTLGNGLALMAAMYVAGESLGPVRSLPPLAFSAVAAVVFEARRGDVDAAAGDIVMALAAWIIGLLVAQRRRRAALQLSAADEELRAASLRAEAALAEERQRMARELHDVVSHGVTIVVMQARGARAMLEVDPDQTRQALDAIERAGQDALADMRRLVTLLREPAPGIRPQPGLEDLEALLVVARREVPVTVTVSGYPVDLPPGLGLTGYRLVQECLTNALRHAPGSAIDARIGWEAEDLTITITNPLVPERPGDVLGDSSGYGLLGLRERVQLYGGTLEYGRSDDLWIVRCSLPLTPAPQSRESAVLPEVGS